MASENHQSPEPISRSVEGTVKWFNVKAGYGFIRRNDNNDDIFVHKASITRPNPSHTIPSLDDSESVIFDIIQSAKGFEAINVTGPGRATVIGNSRAPRRHRRTFDRQFYGGNSFAGNFGGRGSGGPPRQNNMYSGSMGNFNSGTRGRGIGGARGGYAGGGGGRAGNNFYGGGGRMPMRGGRGGPPSGGNPSMRFGSDGPRRGGGISLE